MNSTRFFLLVILLASSVTDQRAFSETESVPEQKFDKYFGLFIKSRTADSLTFLVLDHEAVPQEFYFSENKTKIMVARGVSKYPGYSLEKILLMIQLDPLAVNYTPLSSGRASRIMLRDRIVDAAGLGGFTNINDDHVVLAFWFNNLGDIPFEEDKIRSFYDSQWDELVAKKLVSLKSPRIPLP